VQGAILGTGTPQSVSGAEEMSSPSSAEVCFRHAPRIAAPRARLVLKHTMCGSGREQGPDGNCSGGGTGNSSANDENGLSEETSIGRSRSTSADATVFSKSHSESKAAVEQPASTSIVQGEPCRTVKVLNDDGTISIMENLSGSGSDFDMGDMESADEFDEDDSHADAADDRSPSEPSAQQVTQHAVVIPDFDDITSEASTRSSKAHDERVSRIVEAFFPGHGIIALERLYRSSLPIDRITKESLLSRDHLLLPHSVAAKVASNCALLCV
jgi:hypothetical protein